MLENPNFIVHQSLHCSDVATCIVLLMLQFPFSLGDKTAPKSTKKQPNNVDVPTGSSILDMLKSDTNSVHGTTSMSIDTTFNERKSTMPVRFSRKKSSRRPTARMQAAQALRFSKTASSPNKIGSRISKNAKIDVPTALKEFGNNEFNTVEYMRSEFDSMAFGIDNYAVLTFKLKYYSQATSNALKDVIYSQYKTFIDSSKNIGGIEHGIADTWHMMQSFQKILEYQSNITFDLHGMMPANIQSHAGHSRRASKFKNKRASMQTPKSMQAMPNNVLQLQPTVTTMTQDQKVSNPFDVLDDIKMLVKARKYYDALGSLNKISFDLERWKCEQLDDEHCMLQAVKPATTQDNKTSHSQLRYDFSESIISDEKMETLTIYNKLFQNRNSFYLFEHCVQKIKKHIFRECSKLLQNASLKQFDRRRIATYMLRINGTFHNKGNEVYFQCRTQDLYNHIRHIRFKGDLFNYCLDLCVILYNSIIITSSEYVKILQEVRASLRHRNDQKDLINDRSFLTVWIMDSIQIFYSYFINQVFLYHASLNKVARCLKITFEILNKLSYQGINVWIQIRHKILLQINKAIQQRWNSKTKHQIKSSIIGDNWISKAINSSQLHSPIKKNMSDSQTYSCEIVTDTDLQMKQRQTVENTELTQCSTQEPIPKMIQNSVNVTSSCLFVYDQIESFFCDIRYLLCESSCPWTSVQLCSVIVDSLIDVLEDYCVKLLQIIQNNENSNHQPLSQIQEISIISNVFHLVHDLLPVIYSRLQFIFESIAKMGSLAVQPSLAKLMQFKLKLTRLYKAQIKYVATKHAPIWVTNILRLDNQANINCESIPVNTMNQIITKKDIETLIVSEEFCALIEQLLMLKDVIARHLNPDCIYAILCHCIEQIFVTIVSQINEQCNKDDIYSKYSSQFFLQLLLNIKFFENSCHKFVSSKAQQNVKGLIDQISTIIHKFNQKNEIDFTVLNDIIASTYTKKPHLNISVID